jgi:hypothetical protein
MLVISSERKYAHRLHGVLSPCRRGESSQVWTLREDRYGKGKDGESRAFPCLERATTNRGVASHELHNGHMNQSPDFLDEGAKAVNH